MAAGLATAFLLSLFALKTEDNMSKSSPTNEPTLVVAPHEIPDEVDVCVYLRDEIEQEEELVTLPVDINAATDVQPYNSDHALLEKWVSTLEDPEGLDPSLASMETWRLCQDLMEFTRLAITYQDREMLRYEQSEASVPLQVELIRDYPDVYANLTYESLDAIDNFNIDVWNQIIKFGDVADELDNVPSQQTLRLALKEDRLKAFAALIEQMKGN
jgi:hypothetical protein